MGRLITEWAWLLPGLKPPQKMVLLCMARAAKDEDALFWESQQTICRRTGYDLKTVKAAVKHLITTALIFDTGKRCGRTGSVIIYQIGAFSLADLNDLQATEKALTAERTGRVFTRPVPEDMTTPASPKTDSLPPKDSPEKDYLHRQGSPEKGLLPVDNFEEVAPKWTTLPNEDSPNVVPLNGEGSPHLDPLEPENAVKLARFSHEASPFFPPKLAQKRTTESLKELVKEPNPYLLGGDANNSQPAVKSLPGSRVVKRTKAAIERERLAARYAATRERNQAMVDIDPSGEIVQTDDND